MKRTKPTLTVFKILYGYGKVRSKPAKKHLPMKMSEQQWLDVTRQCELLKIKI